MFPGTLRLPLRSLLLKVPPGNDLPRGAGGVEVPATNPKPFDYQVLAALMKVWCTSQPWSLRRPAAPSHE
jgi:hypothetical protein